MSQSLYVNIGRLPLSKLWTLRFLAFERQRKSCMERTSSVHAWFSLLGRPCQPAETSNACSIRQLFAEGDADGSGFISFDDAGLQKVRFARFIPCPIMCASAPVGIWVCCKLHTFRIWMVSIQKDQQKNKTSAAA